MDLPLELQVPTSRSDVSSSIPPMEGKTKRSLAKPSTRSPNSPKAGESKTIQFDDPLLRETIRLAQQGDAAAFETIYRRFAPRVYAICLRMLHDPNDAEDALQQTFLHLLRTIQTFRGASAFSTWLHRLTINLVLMSLRRKKPAFVSLDDVLPDDDQEIAPVCQIAQPDLQLMGLADRITIEAAIDHLPQGYKRIFLLHDVQGYRHDEIAKILGRTVGNSKSQLHKARKRLREILRTRRLRNATDYGEGTRRMQTLATIS